MIRTYPAECEHYKGGKYEVLGIVRHSEDLSELVLYKSHSNGEMWVRPKDMFFENVIWKDKLVPRFKFLVTNEDKL